MYETINHTCVCKHHTSIMNLPVDFWWYMHLVLGVIHSFLGIFFLSYYPEYVDKTYSEVGLFVPERKNITENLDVVRLEFQKWGEISPGVSLFHKFVTIRRITNACTQSPCTAR